MKHLLLALLALLYAASSSEAQALELSIQDGRVTLTAQDVTIRQILTEWARVGKTRIINVERLGGTPVTLRLEGVPERQALDIVLRTIPGYIAAPRETILGNASMYHTILIMPTTTAVAVRTPPGPPARGNAPVTRLRPPLTPGALPEQVTEPPTEAPEDPIIAAAAAAGLITPQGQIASPGLLPQGPLVLPGMTGAGAQPNQTPPPATPANPWSAPVGTTRPSLPTASPADSSPAQPAGSRPPQADQ